MYTHAFVYTAKHTTQIPIHNAYEADFWEISTRNFQFLLEVSGRKCVLQCVLNVCCSVRYRVCVSVYDVVCGLQCVMQFVMQCMLQCALKQQVVKSQQSACY